MDATRLDVQKLLEERRQTLLEFRDPHRSPYAAIDRRDFAGSAPLTLGSAADCDLLLSDHGHVVLGPAGCDAGVTADAQIEVDRHAPGVAGIGMRRI